MATKNNFLLSMAAALAVFTSCIPEKKYDEALSREKACKDELAALKPNVQQMEEKLKGLNETLAKDVKEIEGLRRDTSIIGSNYRNLTTKYDKLNTLNEQLMDKYTKLFNNSEKDNAKLSGDLQTTQATLLKKEDELKALEVQLNKQKADLDALSAQLKQREARVNELEDVLKKKDQATADLKKKLQDALFNFENKGLTITQKNGKVYVSLDESLLFASGKTAVEPKGAEALKNVAKVLEQNPDINVMVEGHTDDVPMKGNGDIKDNWDLSVMRATSVTKILLQGAPKMDPKRITSSGRGEFFPIDPAKTPEARKKNRRTEIILTPKLDELFKVLENN
ncbi:MAG: yiaD 3 [Bacteroidetes bacterium]|jgi:chemotaxis protein MotB|nr:yiaD 3 [Bacteroidota bacterium]